MHKPSPPSRSQALRLSAVVAIVVLAVISLLVGATAARYCNIVFGTSGINVAAFAVDAATVTSGDLSIDCSSEQTEASYVFAVSNQKGGVTAEVDISYSVTVNLSTALPDGLTLMLDGIRGTASDDGLSHFFEDPAWVLSAGSSTAAEHSLTFSANADTITEDSSIDTISISVTAEQVS